ncbi:MAG: hypothetical protein M3Q24_02255 [bacterium]|nr:hypothetical protein [bacterium]
MEAPADSELEISELEKTVQELKDLVANPEKHGIFDDLGKNNLKEKLRVAEEELAVKTLENL